MKYHSPKGLNDILTDEIEQWHVAETAIRTVMNRYQYREIRTPLLEYTELFERGVGQDTEIVGKQMYTFSDKAGRSLTLRPEGTAPIVRAFLEHKLYGRSELIKLSYLGSMFRYEEPQKGRSRQFEQFGVEAIGSADPALDAEVIELGWSLLTEALGLDGLRLKLNSMGCREDRKRYITELRSYFTPMIETMCPDCQVRLETNPLRILDCNEEICQGPISAVPAMLHYLCDDCEAHFDRLRTHLDDLEILYRLDPTLARGLDYYTRTVFEIASPDLGARDAIIGGGRYDDLVEMLGGPPTPAIGFAGGMPGLILTLNAQKGPLHEQTGPDLYIATVDEQGRREGIRLLRELRRGDITAEIDYLGKSVRGQFGYADRIGARYVIVIGPEELDRGALTLRDMRSGDEARIDLDPEAIAAELSQRLKR
ncbi:MAG: histidine--tRNA ligase [Candidatus Bipolaricaulia bacterium]